MTTEAAAQAWVAEPGNLGLTLGYGLGWSEQIAEGDFVVPGGTLLFQTIALGAEIVPYERLALRTSLPYYLMYWTSENLVGAHGRFDDGSVHGIFQDMSWEVRYMALDTPVAITPLLGVTFPLTDYETRGNAAVGRGLVQGHVGLNIGAFLAPWVPELYTHLRYVFSLVESFALNEETRRFSQHRSELNFQLGYFVLPEMSVYLATDLILYHGGISFTDWRSLSFNLQFNHDLLLQEELFLVGGGVSYQISDNVSIDGSFRFFLLGDNTRTARSVTVSLSWNDFLW